MWSALISALNFMESTNAYILYLYALEFSFTGAEMNVMKPRSASCQNINVNKLCDIMKQDIDSPTR